MTYNLKEGVILDIEVAPNYFLAGFKSLRTGSVLQIESHSKITNEDASKLHTILATKKTIGFNSWKYDVPMLYWIIATKPTTHEIYKKSIALIDKHIKVHTLYDIYNNPSKFDHIDLSEPSPAVMVSLKGYGARLGSRKLQDLPYNPDEILNDEAKEVTKLYNINDLDTTIDLFNSILPRLELRQSMTEQYGIDLMSKSDAQIAEAVFVSELKYRGNTPELPVYYSIRYTAPECIKFNTPMLQNLLTQISEIEFTLDKGGSVTLPKSLANTKLNIGDTTYKLGIGGLHSQEKQLVVESNDFKVLRNADVASYYPSMILEYGWYPKHFGSKFLDVYRRIYETRLKAKKRQKEIESELDNLEKLLVQLEKGN